MTQAALVLEDGSIFHGTGIGHPGQVAGEVVFNTSMTGYQEILSAPDYAQLLVTLASVHIGNVGTNAVDDQAAAGKGAKGLIVHANEVHASNWRSEQNLDDYLKQRGIVGIAGIDTRRLIRQLQRQGTLRGVIATDIEDSDLPGLLDQAGSAPSLIGQNLVTDVSTQKRYTFAQGSYDLSQHARHQPTTLPYHAVVYDLGARTSLLETLVEAGCKLTVVPATTAAQDVLAVKPDLIVFSHGPGDPAAVSVVPEAISALMAANMPMFGVGLGMQLLARSLGATTTKMKRGAFGSNHPVKCLATGAVAITQQSHAFALDRDSLGDNVTVTHESLFDGTVQAIRATQAPLAGMQANLLASTDPRSIHHLFCQFLQTIKEPV